MFIVACEYKENVGDDCPTIKECEPPLVWVNDKCDCLCTNAALKTCFHGTFDFDSCDCICDFGYAGVNCEEYIGDTTVQHMGFTIWTKDSGEADYKIFIDDFNAGDGDFDEEVSASIASLNVNIQCAWDEYRFVIDWDSRSGLGVTECGDMQAYLHENNETSRCVRGYIDVDDHILDEENGRFEADHVFYLVDENRPHDTTKISGIIDWNL